MIAEDSSTIAGITDPVSEGGIGFNFKWDMGWMNDTLRYIGVEPKYREALYLYHCEEYKVNEIAQILGKNPNTVKSLLKRGREKLKLIYGGEKDG